MPAGRRHRGNALTRPVPTIRHHTSPSRQAVGSFVGGRPAPLPRSDTTPIPAVRRSDRSRRRRRRQPRRDGRRLGLARAAQPPVGCLLMTLDAVGARGVRPVESWTHRETRRSRRSVWLVARSDVLTRPARSRRRRSAPVPPLCAAPGEMHGPALTARSRRAMRDLQQGQQGERGKGQPDEHEEQHAFFPGSGERCRSGLPHSAGRHPSIANLRPVAATDVGRPAREPRPPPSGGNWTPHVDELFERPQAVVSSRIPCGVPVWR